MYNFVFWFFYKYFEWRKGFKSVFLASLIVALALLIHIMLLYSVARYLNLITISQLNKSYVERKVIRLPFVLILYLSVYFFYYKSKAEIILETYKSRKYNSYSNILLASGILLLPLILAITITNL